MATSVELRVQRRPSEREAGPIAAKVSLDHHPTKFFKRGLRLPAQDIGRFCRIADEDLDRSTEEKTSAVHFLRFELTDEMAASLKYGVGLGIGVDHPGYSAEIAALPSNIRNSLVNDLA